MSKNKINDKSKALPKVIDKSKHLSKIVNKKASAKKPINLISTINKKIDKDNKAFEVMSASEKRVTIARDVLVQIESRRLKPEFSVWLKKKRGSLFSKPKENEEVRDALAKIKECSGCAIGGMFMCAVERADKLKISELDDAEMCKDYDEDIVVEELSEQDSFNYLKRFFDSDQLELIEAVFESNGGASFVDDAETFAPGLDSPSERMRLIMENIIVNKGTFKLNKLPVAVYKTPGFTG